METRAPGGFVGGGGHGEAACAAELAAARPPAEARGARTLPGRRVGAVLATARPDVQVVLTGDPAEARLAAALAARGDQPAGMARVLACRSLRSTLRGGGAFAVWREAVAAAPAGRADLRPLNAAARELARGGVLASAAHDSLRSALAEMEDGDLAGVARAVRWLLSLGAIPSGLSAADLGYPVAEPARGVVLAWLRPAAVAGVALAAAQPPPLGRDAG